MKHALYPANAVLALAMMLGVIVMHSASALAADRGLSFAVSGVIAEIKVKPGMQIKKGAVLAVLDQRPLLALKKAGDVKVDVATAKYELLARRYEQTQQLFDALSASTENVEDAQLLADVANSELADAKAHASLIAWQVERSTLRAPFGGTVARVPGYPGMVVPDNGTVVPVIVIGVP